MTMLQIRLLDLYKLKYKNEKNIDLQINTLINLQNRIKIFIAFFYIRKTNKESYLQNLK